jgi:nucleotide-binding universal stress UspA family protein
MIKIILVPLDGTERSAEVLDTALILARRFEAHIKVVHVHEAGNESSFFSEMPASLREEFVKMNRKMTAATIDTVREQFKSFCESNKIKVTRKPAVVKEISGSLHILDGDVQTILDHESRLVDVIAISRPARLRVGGPGVGALHESLMLHSGRPILIVPPEWTARRANHAAIGWNDSVEASRALALTLPWLTQMKKISVLASRKREAGALEVMDYLKCHGCRVDHHVFAGGGNVGKKMLATCNEIGAELLVVGGFSHARIRQRLFGGVTTYLLDNTDIITVMAH